MDELDNDMRLVLTELWPRESEKLLNVLVPIRKGF